MENQKQLIEDNCGQTCVAMIAGVSQWDAMHAVGNDHGTQPKALQEALFKFGFIVEREKLKVTAPPALAIGLVRSKIDKTYGHAVVIRDGVVTDPAWSSPVEFHLYLSAIKANGRYFTGCIVVKGKRF